MKTSQESVSRRQLPPFPLSRARRAQQQCHADTWDVLAGYMAAFIASAGMVVILTLLATTLARDFIR